MPYLVDTNIVVDVTRGNATAADYLDSLADAWSISMTCLEPPAGARTPGETADLDLVLSGYRAISPNEDITRRANYLHPVSGSWATGVDREHHGLALPIGNDMWISETASTQARD